MSTIEVKLDDIDACIAALKAVSPGKTCYAGPMSTGAGNVHDHYQGFLTAFESAEIAIDGLIEATIARLTTIRQSFADMDSAVADSMLTSGR